ncbi:hypothetical protein SASPL_115039 [Salvia splendens]|uniref:Uncharacterized protein n=1 Tax=Salvia splendens TaxID=180675 RepID=A0A8X8Y7L2_SALSN|nr:hypothetical protein SASPL_115039 [Salvia splendens]
MHRPPSSDARESGVARVVRVLQPNLFGVGRSSGFLYSQCDYWIHFLCARDSFTSSGNHRYLDLLCLRNCTSFGSKKEVTVSPTNVRIAVSKSILCLQWLQLRSKTNTRAIHLTPSWLFVEGFGLCVMVVGRYIKVSSSRPPHPTL